MFTTLFILTLLCWPTLSGLAMGSPSVAAAQDSQAHRLQRDLNPVPEEPPPSESVSTAPPTSLDERGWHNGTIAAAAGNLLAQSEKQNIQLPPQVLEFVSGPTFILYFSARCPHCIDVISEINELSRRLSGVVPFMAVGSSNSRRTEVEAFRTQYKVPFPIVYDEGAAFAAASGLGSTPSVLVVEESPHSSESGQPSNAVVLDAYLPYIRGSAAIVEMRLRGETETVLQRGDYVGYLTCSSCHLEEARSWSATHHSLAYYSLLRYGDAESPSCLPCHVTNLAGTATGASSGGESFRLNDHRSPMSNVTCESCHTASGPHDGEGGDPAATCATCHSPEHSFFKPETAMALIDHYKAMDISDDQLTEIRLSMAEGSAPRPLLEPPPGHMAGPRSCKKCHSRQYRSWKKSPHSTAYTQLDPQDAARPECISCHSTLIVDDTTMPGDFNGSAPAPQGVSCESCHGPGQDHVNSPAPDNIRGLQSRFPQCSVEALCTTCHTQEWDENWNLMDRLQEVRH